MEKYTRKMLSSLHFLLISLFSFYFFFTDGIQLIIVNNCNSTIWPGILATTGHPTPLGGGFSLSSGKQRIVQVSQNWSGRIWARQGCWFDPHTGRGMCQTGDCGGLLQCNGLGGKPPATLVEVTLGTPTSPLHFYDVSLIDGFNTPVSVIPLMGGGHCEVAACEIDLNECCPSALAMTKKEMVVGCKSPCLATGSPRYCCTGEYSEPEKCQPTIYGRLFKALCPKAYRHPFDEATGLKTCRAPKYVVIFCPPS